MNIPDDLKLLSFIYENRSWVLLPLIVLWGIAGFYLLFRLKKLFFLWLLIFPLVIQPFAQGRLIAVGVTGWNCGNALPKRSGGCEEPDCIRREELLRNVKFLPAAK